MRKQIQCPCGYTIQAETEEQLVAEAQKHAKESHDMELSRDQALAMARPA
jgi:predicted small metal-binding protein